MGVLSDASVICTHLWFVSNSAFSTYLFMFCRLTDMVKRNPGLACNMWLTTDVALHDIYNLGQRLGESYPLIYFDHIRACILSTKHPAPAYQSSPTLVQAWSYGGRDGWRRRARFQPLYAHSRFSVICRRAILTCIVWFFQGTANNGCSAKEGQLGIQAYIALWCWP